MKSKKGTWKRQSLSLALASVIALGTMLSFGAPIHAQASSDKQVGQLEQARTSSQTREDWKNWLSDNAVSLNSINPEQTGSDARIAPEKFADLEALKPLLQDKRIVYLGESSHGAAQYNSAKTRLIQYLHQELGFNVIAFETNLGNAAGAYGNVSSQKPIATMKDSIFRIWQAQETVPLYQYIQDTKRTDKPLMLAGYDMQPQGVMFAADWMGDAKLAKQFQEIELALDEWEMSSDLKGYQKVKPSYLKLYEQIKATIPKREQALRKQFPDNPHIVQLVQRAIDNRIQIVREYMELTIKSTLYMEGKNLDYMSMIQSWEYRDQMMADNLVWLADNVYKNEKIIVWAHNGHISKAHSKEFGIALPLRNMGEIMQTTKYKDRGYVMGLFLGNGQNAHVTREIYDVLPPMPHSIEELMTSIGKPYSFIDMSHAPAVPGTTWMSQPMTSYVTGISPISSIPSEQYDGILFINDVTPPTYLEK
ncbi:erythromycin esterase-like protein [Paenibacillus alvei TS-15]|uniref:Erythromycin esterase-like protein n=1 Tax=Paenibacillus alvei TS-15 TaxID=1117108 RepID=S9SJT0_PAEAL|nr:erythromycin esterase family protein [Paenibacillus alvei]EPY04348.1 erythromycin esterase-like protein [Paenibacillus alvei TS-15]